MSTFFIHNKGTLKSESKILLEKAFTDLLTKIDDLFDEITPIEHHKKEDSRIMLIAPINGTNKHHFKVGEPPKHNGPIKAYNIPH